MLRPGCGVRGGGGGVSVGEVRVLFGARKSCAAWLFRSCLFADAPSTEWGGVCLLLQK